MFLCGGSRVLWSKEAVVVRMASFELDFHHTGTLPKLNWKTNHVRAALEVNGYPLSVISSILNKKPPSPTVPPPEELVSMFFKWADPSDTHKGFAFLPYISGLTEPLTRLLRKNEIRVLNKPFKTLQQEFPSPKFRQPSDLQSNVVYKIPCKDCPWNYIGETGRYFQTRKKNTNEIWRTMLRAQTLQTMRGKTTTLLTSITLVLLTKAIIAFEKH